jgi:hypothetical protein
MMAAATAELRGATTLAPITESIKPTTSASTSTRLNAITSAISASSKNLVHTMIRPTHGTDNHKNSDESKHTRVKTKETKMKLQETVAHDSKVAKARKFSLAKKLSLKVKEPNLIRPELFHEVQLRVSMKQAMVKLANVLVEEGMEAQVDMIALSEAGQAALEKLCVALHERDYAHMFLHEHLEEMLDDDEHTYIMTLVQACQSSRKLKRPESNLSTVKKSIMPWGT